MIKKILTITASVEVEVDENMDVDTVESSKKLSETTSNALECLESLGWKVNIEHFETENEMNERVQYETKNKKITSRDVRLIKVDSKVRYWEDADINGIPDDDENPKIPGVTAEKRWVIKIDTKTGKILNWTNGVTAHVHYKTCDENRISLYDKNGCMLGEEYECYVPKFLEISDRGYGDYIIMDIEKDGKIKDFKFTDKDIEELKENSF